MLQKNLTIIYLTFIFDLQSCQPQDFTPMDKKSIQSNSFLDKIWLKPFSKFGKTEEHGLSHEDFSYPFFNTDFKGDWTSTNSRQFLGNFTQDTGDMTLTFAFDRDNNNRIFLNLIDGRYIDQQYIIVNPLITQENFESETSTFTYHNTTKVYLLDHFGNDFSATYCNISMIVALKNRTNDKPWIDLNNEDYTVQNFWLLKQLGFTN